MIEYNRKNILKAYYGNVEIDEIWIGSKLVFRNNRKYRRIYALIILDGFVVVTKAEGINVDVISSFESLHGTIKNYQMIQPTTTSLEFRVMLDGILRPIAVRYAMPSINYAYVINGVAIGKNFLGKNSEVVYRIKISHAAAGLSSDVLYSSIRNLIYLKCTASTLCGAYTSTYFDYRVLEPVAEFLADFGKGINNDLVDGPNVNVLASADRGTVVAGKFNGFVLISGSVTAGFNGIRHVQEETTLKLYQATLEQDGSVLYVDLPSFVTPTEQANMLEITQVYSVIESTDDPELLEVY